MLAEPMTIERTDIHPSLSEVLELASQGNLIPIYRELPPIWIRRCRCI